MRLPLLIVFILFIVGCGEEHLNRVAQTPATEQIAQVLKQQEENWNLGDIDGYMAGYMASDSLRFASGGTINYGHRAVTERYKKRYGSKASMGELSFDKLDIRPVSDEVAIVFGRWQLKRANDHPWGLFTLLFEKGTDGWKVVHDHTSSGEGNLTDNQ
ncbi:MAG: YybH family protein [Calditrichia bacterium]